MPLMIRSARVILVAMVLTTPALAFQPQQFHGRMQDHLSLQQESTVWKWQPATPAQRKELGNLASRSDRVWRSKMNIAPGRMTPVRAALVESEKQSYTLYLDTDKAGPFTPSETIHFKRSPPGGFLGGSPTARFTLPLHKGPFHSFPVKVTVIRAKGHGSTGTPQTVLMDIGNTLKGYVQLPHRRLLVTYSYNLASGSANLSKTREAMDTNGNGKIDLIREVDVPHNGKLPVFHVGNFYLQTESINLHTRIVTLRTVPKAAYGNRIDWQKGAIVPNFALRNLTGQRETFAHLREKYTLIDFWASWCGPCMAAFPSLKTAYAKYHPRGFQIIGIDGDKTPKVALAALKKVHASWPEARGGALIARFKIQMWPTEILVNKRGEVIDAKPKDLRGTALKKTLARLLPRS